MPQTGFSVQVTNCFLIYQAMPPETLIFDLDGTLVDSAPDLAAAINRVLSEEDQAELSLGAVIDLIGDGAPSLVARAFGHDVRQPPSERLLALQQRFITHYTADIATLTRPYDGVEETLDGLAAEGYRLAICTNKPGEPARDLLRRLDLGRYFSVVVGGDEAPVKKPDPSHVRAVMAALGSTAADTAMIGDSRHDVSAGRAAGAATVAVSYGYAGGGIRRAEADIVIERFDALPDALEQLGRRPAAGSIGLP